MKMNIQEILKCLPHRYPMLMIDRVEQIRKGASITAYKNVSYNEPYFQGHFPNEPLMPGIFILEAMAQAAGILISQELTENQLCVIAAIDNVRFKGKVQVGDRLLIHCNMKFSKMGIWKLDGSVFNTENKFPVASATLTLASSIMDFETSQNIPE